MKYIFVFAAIIVQISMCYGQGFPVANCPSGEHSVLYCPQRAEPSCDNPTLHDLNVPAACGIPQCFCNTPTIRDEKTGKCVKTADCS